MVTAAITHTVVHPQWGAPMEYHKLIRSEADIQANETYVSFASYYNKAVHDTNGMSMSITSARIPQAVFDTVDVLLQAVIDSPDNVLSGGELVIDETPEDEVIE